ncbi:MAG: type III secretion system chaperone family protein [Actinomycetes bacterium]
MVQPAGVSAGATGPVSAAALVHQALVAAGVAFEQPGPGRFVVTLPGEQKLATAASLVVGDYSLSVNAFVARCPEENAEGVYRWLLGQNRRARGAYFAVDHLGDIYLVARIPLAGVGSDELDRLLGAVLEAADSGFPRILEMGFASVIRREWAWRVARGEPTANLAPFEHLVTGLAGSEHESH